MYEILSARNVLLIMEKDLHSLQLKELCEAYPVQSIIDPPPDLKRIWRNLPDRKKFDTALLDPLVGWLKAKSNRNDAVVLQGELGSVFYLANFCFANELVPLYTVEELVCEHKVLDDGTIVNIEKTKHVRFKHFELWDEKCTLMNHLG